MLWLKFKCSNGKRMKVYEIAQNHKMLHECCLDAMDYDDNFELCSSRMGSKEDAERKPIYSPIEK